MGPRPEKDVDILKLEILTIYWAGHAMNLINTRRG